MPNLNWLPLFLFYVIFMKNQKKNVPCCNLDFINESKQELHMKHSHMHNYRKVKMEESTTDLVNGRTEKSYQNMLLKYSAFGEERAAQWVQSSQHFQQFKKRV